MKVVLLDPAPVIVEAMRRLDCRPEDLAWWSWPHIFSSTAGPHKGRIAGQALTWFQVMAFRNCGTSDKSGLVTCDGIWRDWDGDIGGWPYHHHTKNDKTVNRKDLVADGMVSITVDGERYTYKAGIMKEKPDEPGLWAVCFAGWEEKKSSPPVTVLCQVFNHPEYGTLTLHAETWDPDDDAAVEHLSNVMWAVGPLEKLKEP